MSDPIREAYDARRLLMQRLNAILDDRWPLAGKIMAAVDEYAEARSTPAEALDPRRLSEAAGNVLDGRRIGSVRLYRNTITPDDWQAITAEYLRLSPHNREADHE